MTRRFFKDGHHPNFEVTAFLLNQAIEFDAGNPIEFDGLIIEADDKIQLRDHYRIIWKGECGWAIIMYGDMCMSLSKSKKDFVFEPLPSSQDDTFIKDVRFTTVEEALFFLDEWKKEKLAELRLKGFITLKEHLAK